MSRDNNHTIIGNVGKDPKIFDAGGNTVAKFNVAVYRSGKGDSKKSDWIPVTAWHDLARGVEANLKQGDHVVVVGSFQIDSRKNDDGTWNNFYSLNADHIAKQIPLVKESSDEDIPF